MPSLGVSDSSSISEPVLYVINVIFLFVYISTDLIYYESKVL